MAAAPLDHCWEQQDHQNRGGWKALLSHTGPYWVKLGHIGPNCGPEGFELGENALQRFLAELEELILIPTTSHSADPARVGGH